MKKIMAVTVSAALFGSVGAAAEVSDAQWQKLKADFAAMSQRLDALERENQRLRKEAAAPVAVEDLGHEVPVVQTQSRAADWTDSVKLTGNFRYRFERIEEQGKNNRERSRIRARAGIEVTPSKDTEVGLAIASGSDDPISTNQTLGGSGSSKDILLDKAYFTWRGLQNTALTLGKYSNPFNLVQTSGLIWDSDYRPEGIAVQWARDNLFANASYNFIESDSNNDEEALWGLQLGANFGLARDASLTASATYVDIPVKGRSALFNGGFFGNSTEIVNGNEVFANNYSLINASVGLTTAVMELPLNVYADFVENIDADRLSSGYILGVQLGKAKQQGTWQVQYQYQELDADATLGLITDSDFAGGGTDGEGHKLSAKYAIDNKWYVAATYFDATRGVDQGSDADYQRLQFDTGIKY